MRKDTPLPRYTTIEKRIGETPLVALGRLRERDSIPAHVPLAYAGRLDPMASGTLLVLIGDECKKQTHYHALDKEYRVELVLGLHSDSGDVLGIIKPCTQKILSEKEVKSAITACIGDIVLPYPHFSSKTVEGKPLHTWALLGKIDEIEVPKKHSRIHRLTVIDMHTCSRDALVRDARIKIESLPQVTDPKKALGADFRRDAVRRAWNTCAEEGSEAYQIITFVCTASSGTYMRSLCEHIAEKLGTCGMAFSIERTRIGTYLPLTRHHGIWWKQY